MDVIDGFIETIHDLHIHDVVQVLGSKPGIVQFHTRVGQRLHDLLAAGKIGMHKQCLRGIAHGRILRLGVHGDPNSLFDVGELIDINVANAIRMAQHGNLGALLNRANHLVRAPRNDQADQVVHL